MKKMIFTLLTGLMAVVLVACGGNEEGAKAKNDDKAKTAETQSAEGTAKANVRNAKEIRSTANR